MLFEADQNPKVIQTLLGHKSVKTTITTYNSVDKSYFQKATDVINNQFSKDKVKEKQSKEDIDDEIEELERLLEEKRQRKRRKQEEAEM